MTHHPSFTAAPTAPHDSGDARRRFGLPIVLVVAAVAVSACRTTAPEEPEPVPEIIPTLEMPVVQVSPRVPPPGQGGSADDPDASSEVMVVTATPGPQIDWDAIVEGLKATVVAQRTQAAAGATAAPRSGTGGSGSAGGASSVPTGAWRGSYFNNAQLSGSPVLVRNDAAIQFDWGGNAPAPGLPADNFSVRWERRVQFESGAYRFTIVTDDGFRLFVNNNRVLDRFSEGPKHETIDVMLPAGLSTIKLEYYEFRGNAYANLSWDRVSEPRFANWTGAYFNNPNLEGTPVLWRNDTRINFNWRDGSPGPGVQADNFSVRWTGRFNFPEGRYRFTARADDGIRVWIGNDRIINEWGPGGSGANFTHERDLRGDHDLRVEYYEGSGQANVSFAWSRVTGSRTATPTPTQTVGPTPTATGTPSPTTPPLNTATPTLDLPPSATPTATDVPTETPTDEPTPTETPTEDPTPTETPTEEPTPTEPLRVRRGYSSRR